MFKNKTVLITGSNGDVGRKLIKVFLENNAEVICNLRKKNKSFEKFISKLNHKKIKIFYSDINNIDHFNEQFHKIFSKKNKLDILINNAAEPHGSIIEMTSMEKLKKVFETNFFSQIRITQKLLRYLKKSKDPSIINIGSILGVLPEKGTIAYGTSKAAFMHATKIMANEFSVYKIRVNGICPNVIESKMAKKMDINSKKNLIEKSFLKRTCTVNDVANLVLFLSGKNSNYLNGQIINLDGGT